jgi:hypothetical protein
MAIHDESLHIFLPFFKTNSLAWSFFESLHLALKEKFFWWRQTAKSITCYTVVLVMLQRRVGQSMAIGQNWLLTDPKPHDQSKPNSTHYVRGTPQELKLIISRSNGPRHKGQHRSYQLFFLSISFSSFLVTSPRKKGSADIDHLYVKRRDLAQGSASCGS